MNLRLLRTILNGFSYKPGWEFKVIVKETLLFIRVEVEGKCNDTGEPFRWNGRLWYISEHATSSEVKQTVLKAVLTAEEHETRELLKYNDVEIFCPHLNLDDLYRSIYSGRVREDARLPVPA